MTQWVYCVTNWSLEDLGGGRHYVRKPALDWLDAHGPRGTSARWYEAPMVTDTDGVRKPGKGFVLGVIAIPDSADRGQLRSDLDAVNGVTVLPDYQPSEKDEPLQDPTRQNAIDRLNTERGVPESVFNGSSTAKEHIRALASHIDPTVTDILDI